MGAGAESVVPDSVIIFGASRGIGKMLARHFAAKKCPVTAAARTAGDLDLLGKELQGEGLSLRTVAADVGNELHVSGVFTSHRDSFGDAPSLVVNTAGVQGPIGPSWTLSSDAWAAAVQTNLFGTYLVTKAAVQAMMPKGAGSIVHFSGGGSAYARPNFTAYGVSKTGVLRLVETISDELTAAGFPGIVVNAVAPGAVKTRMMDEILHAADRAGQKEKSDAEKVIASGGTPPEQIIALIEFLAHAAVEKKISGRLIHVRESYREFAEKFSGNYPDDAGKLRRVPLP